MGPGNSAVQVLNSFSEITKQLAVTITIKTGVQKYNFSLAQNSQTLQNTKLQNIIAQWNSGITKDANGNNIVDTESIYDSARLFLKDTSGNNLVVDGTPLLMFKVRDVNFPVQAFADVEIDWQNSYLQLQATGAAGQDGEVIEFFVNYLPCK